MAITLSSPEMPNEYLLLANSGVSIKPWFIIRSQEESDALRAQRRIELPDAPDCLPFARRRDNDDIAAFEIDESSATSTKIRGVITDHLSWVQGKDPMAAPVNALDFNAVPYSSHSFLEWLQNTVVPDIVEWGNDPAGILEFINANFGTSS